MGRLVIKAQDPDALMRRSAISIEQHEIEDAVPEDEIEYLNEEIDEEAISMEQDIADIRTIQTRIAALEDICIALENMKEAGENELALAEIASDLAVADTDLKTEEDVLPSLESFIGTRPSTEGVKDSLKKFAAALKDRLERIANRLKASTGNQKALIATVKAQAKSVAESASKRNSDSDPTSDAISAKGQISAILSEGKVPGNYRELMAEVKRINGTIKPLLHEYGSALERSTKTARPGFNSLTWIKKNLKELNSAAPSLVKEISVSSDSRWDGKVTRTQCIGNRKAVFDTRSEQFKAFFKAKQESDDEVRAFADIASDIVSRSTLKVDHYTDDNSSQKRSELKTAVSAFETMSVANSERMASEVLRGLDQLEKYVSNVFPAALASLNKAWEKPVDDEAYNSKDIGYISDYLLLITYELGNQASIVPAICAYYRAALKLAEQSVNQYPKKD